MRSQKLNTKQARGWRIAATISLLALAGVVLEDNRTTVSRMLKLTAKADFGWIVCAVLCMALTFFLAAGVYGLLALHRLRYRETLLIEIAAAFVGRLLPAGLGGLGINGVYLFKRKHTAAEATVVASVNNVVGMSMHVLLLCVVLFFRPTVITQLTHHVRDTTLLELVALTGLVIISLLSVSFIRAKIVRLSKNLWISLRKERPIKICLALLVSAALTCAYTLILYFVARSIHVQISLLEIFIAFSLGVLLGTVAPVPGGLVGTEAGIYSALLGFNVASASAGAMVLIFRLITYWLPLVPGSVTLLAARRKNLV